MRGTDETSGSLFSYVDLEDRIPTKHPLRRIRQVVNDDLASLNADFKALYVPFGRLSIPPERLGAMTAKPVVEPPLGPRAYEARSYCSADAADVRQTLRETG